MDIRYLGLSEDLVEAAKSIGEAACKDKMKEELVGNQKKIDVNKNGKLDADDFKKLRNEESDDKHFSSQSQKMQDAINLHLRKGKSYKDAVEAAKKHVKEEVDEAVNVDVTSPAQKMAKTGKMSLKDKLLSIPRGFKAAKAGKSEVDANLKKEEYTLEEDVLGDRDHYEDLAKKADKASDDADKYGWAGKHKHAAELHANLVKHSGATDKNKKYHQSTQKHHELSAKEAAGRSPKFEETEQIDELSKGTLGSYVKKASKNVADTTYDAGRERSQALNTNDKERYNKAGKSIVKAQKRLAGIQNATAKLTKEQVDEIEALAAKHGLGE